MRGRFGRSGCTVATHDTLSALTFRVIDDLTQPGDNRVERYRGEYADELRVAVATALEAGAAVRTMYDAASAETYTKGDGSPVTDADLASDRIIRERIGAAFPHDPLLTEEGADDETRLGSERVWIADPIDGTQQFIDRTGEFDVALALAVAGRPVVGVLYQPATDQALIAVSGGGAWVCKEGVVTPIRFATRPVEATLSLYTSVYFGAPESLPLLARICARSGANAPGVSRWGVTPRELLPTGRYDALIGLFSPPRRYIAWEWDFAAADLFVHEAGGRFTDLRGHLHHYNKPGGRNQGGLLMSADPRVHELFLMAIAQESDLPPILE